MLSDGGGPLTASWLGLDGEGYWRAAETRGFSYSGSPAELSFTGSTPGPKRDAKNEPGSLWGPLPVSIRCVLGMSPARADSGFRLLSV